MKKDNSGCISGIIILVALAIGAQGGVVGVFVALAIVIVLALVVVSIATKSSQKIIIYKVKMLLCLKTIHLESMMQQTILNWLKFSN